MALVFICVFLHKDNKKEYNVLLLFVFKCCLGLEHSFSSVACYFFHFSASSLLDIYYRPNYPENVFSSYFFLLFLSMSLSFLLRSNSSFDLSLCTVILGTVGVLSSLIHLAVKLMDNNLYLCISQLFLSLQISFLEGIFLEIFIALKIFLSVVLL